MNPRQEVVGEKGEVNNTTFQALKQYHNSAPNGDF